MSLVTTVRRGVGLFFATLLATPLVAAGLTAPAHADEIAWSVAPADRDGADGRVSLRHEVAPGATVTDHVVVHNTGDVRTTYEVSVGDGVVGADGAFDISAETPQGSGAWLSVAGLRDGEITLRPGARRVLPVKVRVPEDAIPGDHPAGLTVGVADKKGQLRMTHRIGVRLHLRVTGDVLADLEVSDVRTEFRGSTVPFAEGAWQVSWTVTNAGNVRLGAGTSLSASGPNGWGAAEGSPGEPVELLPGDSTTLTHTLDVAPWGRLGGELEVAPVSLGDDAVDVGDPATVALEGWALPWKEAAVLLGVVAGGMLLLARRRGARRSSQGVAPLGT